MPNHVRPISQAGTGSPQPDGGIHSAAWKKLQGAGGDPMKEFAAFNAEEREREDSRPGFVGQPLEGDARHMAKERSYAPSRGCSGYASSQGSRPIGVI